MFKNVFTCHLAEYTRYISLVTGHVRDVIYHLTNSTFIFAEVSFFNITYALDGVLK